MTAQGEVNEHRVAFDFEIAFSNGGGLKGWDFRLDIEGDTISDDELASYIVRDLRLLMVGSVKILNKQILHEKHKRISTPAPKPAASQASMESIFDLSHPISHGLQFHPGLPGDAGTTIRFPRDKDISHFPLAGTVNLPAIIVRLTGMSGQAVTRLALTPAIENAAGKAILIETGWSNAGDGPNVPPFLTADAAHYLQSLDVALVGIDSPNVDAIGDNAQPAQTLLLNSGIPIVERLANLGSLPVSDLHFSAAPVQITGPGSLPVRAWARTQHFL